MRRVIVLALLLMLACGAWAYISPRLAAKRFHDAVVAGDEKAVNAAVDFAAVREHLKADLRNHANPLSARLGAVFGGVVSDAAVERLVSAASIIRLARYGTLYPSANSVQIGLLGMGYRDLSDFGVTMGNAQRRAQDMVTFVFHRSGLSWRLAQLEIPSLTR